MKQRRKFKCWNCERAYSLLLDFEGLPTLAVGCPYCGKDGMVDLNLFPKKTVDVFRADTPGQEHLGTTLDLPDIIPTSPPEE